MQQELIDSVRIDSVRKSGREIRLRLLWRPVAAALAWCEHHREELLGMGGDAEESLGCIVSLHVGFDCVEATVLEVVFRRDASGVPYVLPARSRPQGEPLCCLGSRAMEELAALFVSESGNGNGPGTIWNLLWSTPWIAVVIEALRGAHSKETISEQVHRHGLPANTFEFAKRLWPEAYGNLARPSEGPLASISSPW